MRWLAVVGGNIAGKLGELNSPQDSGSPEFKKRQAIREYNALLDRTDPTEPAGDPCMKCLSSQKGRRRNERHDLIRKVQNDAAAEPNHVVQMRMLETADRLSKDMDRVEDARLSLHTYTANEDGPQEEFLKPLRDQAPPGFKIASLDKVADDFGVNPEALKDMLNNKEYPSQKIMIYERDPDILGSIPKYTIAFRGSTTDKGDWNNNGRNEAGVEAPHQKKAAELGSFLAEGATAKGESIDTLVEATGHSKGGSEAQAFAAASGCVARVFNPAGFSPSQYDETAGVSEEDMRIDKTIVIDKDINGNVLPSTNKNVHTDPLYYAQHVALTKFVMKKPVKSSPTRELSPIDPDLAVPCKEQSETEAHSMLQVIEAMERDKKADQEALIRYTAV
uniref:Phospholipase n=1 Tax=Geobacter sp. (strain M21) TaxID=443144 RepID=C6E147_GEOSM